MITCNLGGCIKEKEICCQSCDERAGCSGYCNDTADNGIEVFKTTAEVVIQSITDICKAKKDLEEQEKDLKYQLKDAMERHDIKSFNNDVLKITYIAATKAVTVDSKKLKAQYPQIAAECSKISPKAAYVKVELQ